MERLNCTAFIIKPTRQCLEWINALPNTEKPLEFDDILFNCTTILIPQFNNCLELNDFIKEKYLILFDKELASWEKDHALWPSDKTLDHFLEMFDLEFHTEIFEVG